MELKEIYEKNIERHINPAVVVGEMEDRFVNQEIEEYVFTKEIIENIYKFLNAVINKNEGKTGIWINGYYGSGKSHFIKYVFYCLNQKTREKAIQRFKEAIKENDALDPLGDVTLSNVENIEQKLNDYTIDEIIFNIDSVSESKKDEQTITKILLNELNGKRGYNKVNSTVARLIERELDKKGQFEAFKNRVQEVVGAEWLPTNVNNHIQLKLSKIIEIAYEFDNDIDKESLRKAIKDDSDFTIELLIEEFKNYLSEKPDDYRLIFLMDEMSQYIGTNTSLLLNLQTIVEDVSKHLENKVWIACTAQQDLSDLVNATEKKSEDFGKIMGRFETLISLASQDSAYITQKRILDKNAQGLAVLTDFYSKNKGAVENQFVAGHSVYKSYESADQFYLAYPFIPYQFRLISDVFQSFANIGFVTEGVKNTERAILGITHTAAQEQKDKEVGYFISFDNFFNDKLSSNLTNIARDILGRSYQIDFKDDQKELAKRVIHVLFMISNLEENIKVSFPPTAQNVTLLLLTDVKTVKAQLQNEVQVILDKLVDENIVQLSEGKYIFLDDEGIKVANGITTTSINSHDVLKYFYESFIKKSLKPDASIDLGSKRVKATLAIDDKIEMSGGEFEIKFVVYDSTSPNQLALDVPSSSLLINIGEWFHQNADFKKDFIHYCKTIKYLEENRSNASGDRLKKIEEFGNESVKLLKDLQIRFDKYFVETSFISKQTVVPANEINASSPAERYKEMVNRHVSQLYKNHNWSEHYAQSNSDLQANIQRKLNQATIDNSLNLAEEEVNNRITQTGDEVNLSDLVKFFEKAPYGWKDLATLEIVFELVRKNQRAIYYLNDELETSRYYDLAINSQSRQGIEVKKVQDFEQGLIDDFKNAINQIFVSYSFDANQGVADMIDSIKENLFKPQLKDINLYKENYQGYPFSATFNNYHRQLADIYDTKSTERFMKKTIEVQNELRTLRDNYTNLKDFVDNNFANYTKIRDFITQERTNLDKLEEKETDIEKITTYISTEKQPALQFPVFLKLYKELKQAIKDLLGEYQSKVAEQYALIFDELEQERTKFKLDASTLPDNESYLNRIKTNKDIGQLEVLEAKASSFRLEYLKLLADEHNKQQAAEKGMPYQDSKIKAVDVSNTFVAGKTLASPEEVDEFIEELRNKLMLEIGKNGKIFLE